MLSQVETPGDSGGGQGILHKKELEPRWAKVSWWSTSKWLPIILSYHTHVPVSSSMDRLTGMTNKICRSDII